MKPLYLIRTLIILFSLSGSGSLFAGMNPDGTITFEPGQIQFASSFAWGQSLPNTARMSFITVPTSSPGIENVVTTSTMTYTSPAAAAEHANNFLQHVQPVCGGGAVINGSSVTYTVNLSFCYIQPGYYLIVVQVTTPGGWPNCRSTTLLPVINRKVTSSADGIIYNQDIRFQTAQRTYDADGVMTSAVIDGTTISGGNSATATTYRRVSSYESTISITETPIFFTSNPHQERLISCAGKQHQVMRTNVSTTNGYIRFVSDLSTDHLNVISSTLQGSVSQVNNRVISPALDVIPSSTINVGSIAGFTYPEWHEYPFQITAVSNVENNVGASIDFPVLVRWTCTPPTGNVNFEIRSPSGTNLCNGQETSHPAVTTPLDVRAAWRPSSASATGTWSAAATVEYILP